MSTLKLRISELYYRYGLLIWVVPAFIFISCLTAIVHISPAFTAVHTETVKVKLYTKTFSQSPSVSPYDIKSDMPMIDDTTENTSQSNDSQNTEKGVDTTTQETAQTVTHAIQLDFKKPIYPPLSKRLGEEGDVYAIVSVNEHDTIVTVIIERSSGFSRLDNAVIATLTNATVRSATVNGKKIADSVRVGPFKFRIIESD